MKDVLKKWGPTLVPVVGLLLTMTLPSIQSWIAHVVAPAFAHLLVMHPAIASAVFTVICAVYHALPSPYQK
jgi:hypothetical protein